MPYREQPKVVQGLRKKKRRKIKGERKEMNIKRIVAAILALMMLLTLAACGEEKEEEQDDGSSIQE